MRGLIPGGVWCLLTTLTTSIAILSGGTILANELFSEKTLSSTVDVKTVSHDANSAQALSVYGGFSARDLTFKTQAGFATNEDMPSAVRAAITKAKSTCEENLQGCWELALVTGNECLAFAVFNERLWIDTGTIGQLYSSHGSYPNFAILCANGQVHSQILDGSTMEYSGIPVGGVE